MQHLYPIGLKVSDFSQAELETYVDQVIQQKSETIVFGYSLGYVTLYKKYPSLYREVNEFDLMLCDGVPFHWFLNSMGIRLRHVISIPEFSEWIVERCAQKGWSLMIIGGTAEINQRASENTRNRFPSINVIDGRDGYFSLEEEQIVLDQIRAAQPDVLLVAMSTPKKEEFVIRNKGKLGATMVIPCGGMVDVLAGKTTRSPRWIKRMGLATFYRIAQEPRRLMRAHMKMVVEAMFKLMPIAWWNMMTRKRKGVEILERYTHKSL
jgi:N-acetylglucosaminyldiphosphoundecaprenol N-acetyl-beta-D-mannosaminyltransferase